MLCAGGQEGKDDDQGDFGGTPLIFSPILAHILTHILTQILTHVLTPILTYILTHILTQERMPAKGTQGGPLWAPTLRLTKSFWQES